MPKTLIICIDGTWNAPGQTDQDPFTHEEMATKTNVARTWEAVTGKTLPLTHSYGIISNLLNQSGEAIYLNGVGSSGSKFQQNFDGSSGEGTAMRIRDAYRFIAERWEEGDHIYAFGFSRGAFAVRSALGFIAYAGLPKQRTLILEDDLKQLFERYRTKTDTPDWTRRDVPVHFLGLWDTVGALAFGDTLNHFHQLNPDNVRCCRQALALDEVRKQFAPEYWAPASEGDFREAWFVGAHSNIGGGYVDSNLSDIALFWVLDQAKQSGLQLDLEQISGWSQENPLGEIRASYTEFWNNSPIGKWVEKRQLAQQIRIIQSNQYIHQSALIAAQNGYQPTAKFADGKRELAAKVEPWHEPIAAQ
jgi:uncharacterized protein (DUF2235 family)